MSGITLEKATQGQKINLSKNSAAAGAALNSILVGCGWDPIAGAGSFDADLSMAFVGADGKCKDATRFLYYNSPKNGAGLLIAGDYAVHTGDNLTGEGDGDDEAIKLDLTKIPADVTKVEVYVNIHEAQSRNQNFGMVENAFVRIENTSGDTPEEMTRFDLDFDASTDTAVKFGSLLKRNNEWYFSANKTSEAGGLAGITQRLGF